MGNVQWSCDSGDDMNRCVFFGFAFLWLTADNNFGSVFEEDEREWWEHSSKAAAVETVPEGLKAAFKDCRARGRTKLG